MCNQPIGIHVLGIVCCGQIFLEVWDVKTTYRKTCAGNLLMWSDLTLGPSFKVKRRCPNLKVPISLLLLVLLLVKRGWPSLKVPISSLLLLPEVWDVKLTLNSTFLHILEIIPLQWSCFQKIFIPLKMTPFSMFAFLLVFQCTQICLYLLNRAR